MEMKPYRRPKNQGRSSAQYTHPQGPPYYTPMDYTAAATSASAIYPYPPPTAAAYYPPPPQAPYFGYPTDKRTVEGMVRKQIEYYLSEENLIKDVFLRNKMDKDGFVLLREIAQFQRVASLTQDMDTVVSALKESETIEICDGIKIRPKKDPLRWPFPTNVLQYLPQPQAPQQMPQQPQPPLIQPRTELHATRLPTQPQQQQPQQQQQLQQLTTAATTATSSIQDQPEPDLPPPQQLLSQQKQQPQQHQPNQKQPQPGPTQSDASSPNNSSSSDISSGTNNLDNINRSSFTYATAVTNKPTAASVVAGTAAVIPAGTVGSNSNANSNSNMSNHHHHHSNSNSNNNNNNNNINTNTNNNINNAPTNGPTVASVVAGTAAVVPSTGTSGSWLDINNKHNKSSTPVESEWKEVKSRRRRPGKA